VDAIARFKELKDRFGRTDLEDASAAGEFLHDLVTEAQVFAALDEARADYLHLRGVVRFVGANASPEPFTGAPGKRVPVQYLATPRIAFYVQELGRAMSDLQESIELRASIVATTRRGARSPSWRTPPRANS
jgi:hypothetical protein